MLNISDLFGHFANAMYSIGTNFKNIFYLRIFVLIGAFSEIYYSATISEKPLWTSIIWLVVFVLINLYHLVLLIIERRGLEFDEEEKRIKQLVFAGMSRIHFKKLMRIAKWKEFADDEILITKGVKINELLLISNGEVVIDVDGKIVNKVSDGAFVGEISFLTGVEPTASVITKTPIKIVFWNKHELEKLIRKDQTLKNDLYNAFSSDLINKLIELNRKQTT